MVLYYTLMQFGILLICIAHVTCKRHTIYWDTRLEPRLKNELTLEVDVNDWMDILCPHKSSFNRSAADSKSLYLEVYNVSAAYYKHCAVTGQQRLLHCKDPRQEIKLTAKFQTRSPSPIGFIFRPGHTYYYLSKPSESKTAGCKSDTLRMKIRVRERNHGNKNSISQEKSVRSNQYLTGESSENRRHHNHEKSLHKKQALINPIKESATTVKAAASDGKIPPGNSAVSALLSSSARCWFAFSCIIFILINSSVM